jgi:ferrochelatase
LSDCCKEINQANQNCYRAQSFATARALAERLGIKDGQYEVAFQSRLKGAPWIRPFSDDFYRELPKRGVKKLVVVSPSFVADCLETLEEVQMRGKEEFVENGGDDLVLIPSLNAEEPWVEAVGQIVENYQPNT